jgi:dTDP-glucose 4,6-dehydratase/UDP-glucose 4-epimerase
MNILIIGSEGFIGKHLLNHLKKKHLNTFGADILDIKNQNYFLINKLNTNFEELFKNNKFDLCINASGAASVPNSILNPKIDFQLNVLNVFDILDSLRQFAPLCKFLNLSSAAIYGNPIELPITETLIPLPLSPYGFHKYQSEIICKEFNNVYSIQTLSVRIFSAYGEGLKKQLFWDTYNKIKDAKNSEIFLHGTGMETRDFIYISDLVNAIDIILNNFDFNGSSINIGSGTQTTILEAVETFVNIINPNIKINFNQKNRIGDPELWIANISRLTNFGFNISYDLKSGLKNYYSWLVKN